MDYESREMLSVQAYPKNINWRAKRLAVLWFRTNNPEIFTNEKYALELSDYYYYLGIPNEVSDKATRYYRKFYGDNN
jgi:hypothetical protein